MPEVKNKAVHYTEVINKHHMWYVSW